MNSVMAGLWSAAAPPPSEERARSQRMALAEARAESAAKPRVEAGNPAVKMLAAYWRRSPQHTASAT
jgi:hypothetical protein